MFNWSWEPQIVLVLLVQAGAYLACVGPLRRFFRGSAPVPYHQQLTFLLGSLTMFIALVSPLAVLSDGYLFSAHMTQHVLVTEVAPPLLLLGTPRWLFRPLVELPIVRDITLSLGKFVLHPVFVLVIFNAVFSIWHMPRYYEASLYNPAVHAVQHIAFFGTATLAWWPIFSTLDEFPQLHPGMKCLYLFWMAVPPTLVGAIIAFAKEPIYPTYAAAPRVWGISVLLDQQMAGLIMWIIGGLIYFGVLTILFFRWFGRDDDDYWEEDVDLATNATHVVNV